MEQTLFHVPKGGKPCLTACGTTERSGTCGRPTTQYRPRRGRTAATHYSIRKYLISTSTPLSSSKDSSSSRKPTFLWCSFCLFIYSTTPSFADAEHVKAQYDLPQPQNRGNLSCSSRMNMLDDVFKSRIKSATANDGGICTNKCIWSGIPPIRYSTQPLDFTKPQTYRYRHSSCASAIAGTLPFGRNTMW